MLKPLYTTLLLLLSLAFVGSLQAQDDDDYDPSQYEAADDTKIKAYCNNKVQNLSPSNLLSVGYDVVMPFDLQSTRTSDGSESTTPMGYNHGFRIETNYPVISKSSLIVNIYANYWRANFGLANDFAGEVPEFGRNLSRHALQTIALGAIVFKPIDEKKFMIFQLEPSVNGNYSFDYGGPDLSKMKLSGSFIYGWKFSDYTNLGFGVTRTYRGGRLLHLPVLLYNKTFNEKWGTEMLIPARAHLRYNFSVKSLLLFGYELEGQSYHMQSMSNAPFNTFNPNTDLELRRSEIRARLQYRRSLSNFIWLDAQAGARIAYRFDMDESEAMKEAVLENNIGIPLYFRLGIALVSP
jgi:hypothetical protein